MYGCLIGIMMLALGGPPANEDPSGVMDENMLGGIAEQQLRTAGLSADSFASELWPALRKRTMETIELRHDLKALKSELQSLRDELVGLQNFIEDHEQFGKDYTSYRDVIAETQRLTAAQAAVKRQQEQFERDRKREEIRLKKDEAAAKRKAAKSVNQRLEKLGFAAIGQDVWLSRSAYSYAATNVPEQRVYYQPTLTGELRALTTIENREEVDYTKMTISGSLLNGDATTRNIGVAFVFRDTHGNQIGQETVIIENARPDVPYPFTSELVMASDLPFASHTSWVLFADTSPPTNTSTRPGGQPSNPTP
jgi:Tfp pilus assembly protein PilE